MELLKDAFEAATNSIFFSIGLTMVCYRIGRWVAGKSQRVWANPFLIALLLIVAFLQVSGVSLESYSQGADLMSLMLIPATAVLGISIYRQRVFMRENFLPIVLGCLSGGVVSIATVYALCRLLGVDRALEISLMPKSVTTPIAMELSRLSGGLVPLSVAAVAFTGIVGVVLGPILTRLLKIDDPIVTGVAYGTASHVIGTTKALELGETEGAASGISICVTGLATVLLFLVLFIS